MEICETAPLSRHVLPNPGSLQDALSSRLPLKPRRTDLHHLTHENGHVAHRLPAKSSQRMTNGPGVYSLVADLNVISCWFSEAGARLYALCARAQRTTKISDVDNCLGSC